ncbi:hypothetical protein PR048_027910 [Dryococelus australis]|uniref:Uncharacterized protein n=1 Tax=Dryococelus australis TaxID=614101 RepID=A0ABQ9GHW4_9NEOP|nr:hypothetical protein PR048_027910 [Dryococelus australis]
MHVQRGKHDRIEVGNPLTESNRYVMGINAPPALRPYPCLSRLSREAERSSGHGGIRASPPALGNFRQAGPPRLIDLWLVLRAFGLPRRQLPGTVERVSQCSEPDRHNKAAPTKITLLQIETSYATVRFTTKRKTSKLFYAGQFCSGVNGVRVKWSGFLGHSVRKLSRQEQIRVKMEVGNAIFQAELRDAQTTVSPTIPHQVQHSPSTASENVSSGTPSPRAPPHCVEASGCATMPLGMFTRAEYADMAFVYGYCDGNERGAAAEYPLRWIGTGGPVPWPKRSPDLSLFDFLFWGYLKSRVYSGWLSETRDQLLQAITDATNQHRNELARMQCHHAMVGYNVSQPVYSQMVPILNSLCETFTLSHLRRFTKQLQVPLTKPELLARQDELVNLRYLLAAFSVCDSLKNPGNNLHELHDFGKILHPPRFLLTIQDNTIQQKNAFLRETVINAFLTKILPPQVAKLINSKSKKKGQRLAWPLYINLEHHNRTHKSSAIHSSCMKHSKNDQFRYFLNARNKGEKTLTRAWKYGRPQRWKTG